MAPRQSTFHDGELEKGGRFTKQLAVGLRVPSKRTWNPPEPPFERNKKLAGSMLGRAGHPVQKLGQRLAAT